MEETDVYKLRIEDYGRERQSLRDMEWRVFFETFAGYAALAICFVKVHDQTPHSRVVLALGILASLVLCFFGSFVLNEIHIRMRSTGDLKRAYFRRLHELTGVKAEEESKGLRWWWATLPQLVLLVSVALGFIVWMSYSTVK